jgi:hypothetical protein
MCCSIAMRMYYPRFHHGTGEMRQAAILMILNQADADWGSGEYSIDFQMQSGEVVKANRVWFYWQHDENLIQYEPPKGVVAYLDGDKIQQIKVR